MAQADPRSLTPEEAAAAIRLLRDPKARTEAIHAARDTLGSGAFIRQIAKAAADTYRDPEFWQRALQALQESFRDPEVWQRAAQLAAEGHAAEQRPSLAVTVREAYGSEPGGADLVDATRALEHEMAAAEESAPQRSEPVPLGRRLASLPVAAQAGVLAAALEVLRTFLPVAERAADLKPSEGMNEAILFAFAVAGFLLIWIPLLYGSRGLVCHQSVTSGRTEHRRHEP